MKQLVLCTLFAVLISTNMSFTLFEPKDERSEIIGSWEYIAPSAALGYQKGSLTFDVEKGELVGLVKLIDRSFLMRKLIYEENKVRGYIIVDGRQIDLYIKFFEDSFEATVSNSFGYMRVSGTKTVQDDTNYKVSKA